MIKSIFFLGIVLCLFVSWNEQRGSSLHPGVIKLDGVISTGEWEGATEYALHNSGKILLKPDGKQIWIALVNDHYSWAHLYLRNADTIVVMHASAALGAARYIRRNDFWSPIQSFQWELRDRLYNAQLEAAQMEYFNRTGWVANNNNMGNGSVLEFRVNTAGLKGPVSFAAVVASELPLFQYFPVTLKDQSLHVPLVQGNTPDSLHFSPAEWFELPSASSR